MGSQQARRVIQGRGQQSGRDKAEKHQVDMNGARAAELNIFDIAQEVRCDQVAGRNHPKAGCKGKPQRGSECECFGSKVVGLGMFYALSQISRSLSGVW